MGPRIPATLLRRFWTMLAHEQAQVLNAARLAGALNISGQTVVRYLDLLEDLLLVRRLQAWSNNSKKRRVRSPGVYCRDSGLVHALLRLGSLEGVLNHPVVGNSWEGFVNKNLLRSAPTGTSSYFYRTAAGAEVDLVLEFATGECRGIEIKRSSNPALSKGFHAGCKEIAARRQMVVHGGDETTVTADGIEAVTLEDAIRAVSVGP